MDRRAFKNFIKKRSTIWTVSLCMTGILVLGGIAAINKTRSTDEEPESEISQQAYLEEELEAQDDAEKDELLPTLTDDDADELAQASGSAVDEDTAESTSADEETVDANADGSETADIADLTQSDDSEPVNADGSTSEDSKAEEGASVEDTDASAEAASPENVAADADEVSADTVVSADDGADDSEAAASGSVISEQTLIDAGILFSEDSALQWPAAGTILIDYSMDASVYFETLNQYKYNPALIISSDVGNQVLASAKGIVESISIENETGTTLVLNIGNGYKLTYGQLKEVAVAEGDIVEQGELLGYVSEPTIYYSEEGSNLYFKMTLNDEAVDPVLYLE